MDIVIGVAGLAGLASIIVMWCSASSPKTSYNEEPNKCCEGIFPPKKEKT